MALFRAIESALPANRRQLVILGAGFDARPQVP
jgi:O-methyltransferase involved in polyketide biosynthesis